MKKYVFLVMFSITFPAAAYQTGATNRTNFGAGAQQPSTQQYRSFSNYNNRNWGQGVQTRGVQTNIAGSQTTDFEAPAQPKEPAAKVVKKQAAAEPKVNKPAAPATTPAANQAQPAAAMPPEAAAMMQQVQGLMNAMGGGTLPQGQTPAGKPGTSAAVPAGMPDVSALMGGMMPTAPQPAPVKK